MSPDQKWTPCRRHLFLTLYAVTPQHRYAASWRIPTHLWEAIKKDPELNGDWLEGTHRRLLGQPVHLIPTGLDTVQIVVEIDCRPSRR